MLNIVNEKLLDRPRRFFSRKRLRNRSTVNSYAPHNDVIPLHPTDQWSSQVCGSILSDPVKIAKRDSYALFKLIQKYMDDRESVKSTLSESALQELVSQGWQFPIVRDEILMLIFKQTRDSSLWSKEKRGWELLAVCLAFFPPQSIDTHCVLESYFKHTLDSEVVVNKSFGMQTDSKFYATQCFNRLIRVKIHGPRKGAQSPSTEEVQTARTTIYNPSTFGTSLSQLMNFQSKLPVFRNLKIPWIQLALSQAILQLNGLSTEGIFRIPGDIDSVNTLKAKCEQWNLPIDSTTSNDAHVIASLLKLWYRELPQPLIPEDLYMECINAEHNEQSLETVQKLPTLNRNVLAYLIQFLQMFAKQANVRKTKMDTRNLSLIMAPNCLRYPNTDPKIIIKNVQKEVRFLCFLIESWKSDIQWPMTISVPSDSTTTPLPIEKSNTKNQCSCIQLHSSRKGHDHTCKSIIMSKKEQQHQEEDSFDDEDSHV